MSVEAMEVGELAKVAFVISPIGAPESADFRRHRHFLDYVVKKALLPPEWQVIRADEEESPDSIGNKVVERILESDLVVANLTDQNPNVFYELAIAHGYKRPVVHMAEVGQSLPFDIADQRTIFFDLSDPESLYDAQASLRSSVSFVLGAKQQPKNPLSTFEVFKAISASSSGSDAGEAVADALTEVQGTLGAISRRLSRLERSGAGSPPRRLLTTSELRLRQSDLRKRIELLEARNDASTKTRSELNALQDELRYLRKATHDAGLSWWPVEGSQPLFDADGHDDDESSAAG